MSYQSWYKRSCSHSSFPLMAGPPFHTVPPSRTRPRVHHSSSHPACIATMLGSPACPLSNLFYPCWVSWPWMHRAPCPPLDLLPRGMQHQHPNQPATTIFMHTSALRSILCARNVEAAMVLVLACSSSWFSWWVVIFLLPAQFVCVLLQNDFQILSTVNADLLTCQTEQPRQEAARLQDSLQKH